MDQSAVEQVATALWPLIATGAVQRVGELGTDHGLQQADSLLRKVRARRRARGAAEAPGSLEELREELAQLLREDAGAQEAMQVVVNEFHSPVTVSGGTIGIVNN